jgi:hypothetical protein
LRDSPAGHGDAIRACAVVRRLRNCTPLVGRRSQRLIGTRCARTGVLAARGAQPRFPGRLRNRTMGLLKSLLIPIRRIAHFPLFQLALTVAVILWLQAGESSSLRGQIFDLLDRGALRGSLQRQGLHSIMAHAGIQDRLCVSHWIDPCVPRQAPRQGGRRAHRAL